MPGAGEFAIRKLPSRVVSIDKPAPDVAIAAGCSCRPTTCSSTAPASTSSSSCATARGAATRWPTRRTRIGDKPQIELHLRHLPGGKFTDHVFSAMKEKDILRVEGPFGSFFLREDSDKPMVLLASGTGFAPIKAIIEHMIWKGSERKAVLYWGCRSKADLYMNDWAEEATQRLPHLRYVPVLSEPKPEDGWTGRTGLVHQAVMHDLPEPDGAPGLRLRRADHGRVGAARLHRPLRPARRRVLRRLVHVRGRQARAAGLGQAPASPGRGPDSRWPVWLWRGISGNIAAPDRQAALRFKERSLGDHDEDCIRDHDELASAPARVAADSIARVLTLAACLGASTAAFGQAGPAGGNAADTLEKCSKTLGVLRIQEDTSAAWYRYYGPRLGSTAPLLSMMILQSNCFVVVERGTGEASLNAETRARAATRRARAEPAARASRWSPTICSSPRS